MSATHNFCLVAFLTAVNLWTPTTFGAVDPGRYGAVIRKAAMPATVLVMAKGRKGRSSFGTGSIVNRSGVIITNEHVVKGISIDKISIQTNEGREYRCKAVVALYKILDVAVISCAIPKSKIPGVVRISPQDGAVGETVYALGHPVGVNWAVSQGVVTAHPFQGATYHDALLDHGNSGGPLLNQYGQMVGMNSALVKRRSGASNPIGMALDASVVRIILDANGITYATGKLLPGIWAEEVVSLRESVRSLNEAEQRATLDAQAQRSRSVELEERLASTEAQKQAAENRAILAERNIPESQSVPPSPSRQASQGAGTSDALAYNPRVFSQGDSSRFRFEGGVLGGLDGNFAGEEDQTGAVGTDSEKHSEPKASLSGYVSAYLRPFEDSSSTFLNRALVGARYKVGSLSQAAADGLYGALEASRSNDPATTLKVCDGSGSTPLQDFPFVEEALAIQFWNWLGISSGRGRARVERAAEEGDLGNTAFDLVYRVASISATGGGPITVTCGASALWTDSGHDPMARLECGFGLRLDM